LIDAAGRILLVDFHLAAEVMGECHDCPDDEFVLDLLRHHSDDMEDESSVDSFDETLDGDEATEKGEDDSNTVGFDVVLDGDDA
jgi:hypothetical protein